MKFVLPESQHSGADIAVNKTDRKLQIVEEIRQLLQTIDCDLNDVKDNVENVTSSANNTITCPTTTKQPKVLSFPGISQILPHLYLCGAGVAMPHILDQLGVSFIISAAPELPDTPLSTITKPLYLRIPLLDRPDANLSQYFNEVADMIEEVRKHGGITLVHCVAGVSRSATLCIAYLMKHAKMTLREAYQHVKAKRPQIRPNTGFFEQLRAFDEQLYGKCSVVMIYFESLQKEIPDVLEPEYRAMEEFYQRQRKVPKRS